MQTVCACAFVAARVYFIVFVCYICLCMCVFECVCVLVNVFTWTSIYVWLTHLCAHVCFGAYMCVYTCA